MPAPRKDRASKTSSLLPKLRGSLQQRRETVQIQWKTLLRATRCRSNFGPDTRAHSQKILHHLRIELGAGKAADLRAGVFVAQSLPVRPVGSHDVQRVGHRK